MASPSDRVCELLSSLTQGNAAAVEELFPLLYEELHRLAERYMHGERAQHTLQATALVHEAWLSMMSSAANGDAKILTRDHFMAQASVVMRHILINHAKAKKTDKRGGSWERVVVDEIAADFENNSIDLLALNEAMEQLRELDHRQFQIVEMRFFGGMSMEQCASVLDISVRTAFQEWAHARAWLRMQLQRE